MEEKDLYKIISSSEETKNKTIITIKLEILKVEEDKETFPSESAGNFHSCIIALHKCMLNRVEEIFYSCYGESPNMMNAPRQHYLSQIVSKLNYEELAALRSALWPRIT